MSDDKLDRISEILSRRVAPEVRSLVKMVRVVRWLVATTLAISLLGPVAVIIVLLGR